MSTLWDGLTIFGSLAVSALGVYVSTKWLLLVRSRRDRLVLCAYLLIVACMVSVAVSWLLWGHWLYGSMRTPLEGRLEKARSVTRAFAVYCRAGGRRGPWPVIAPESSGETAAEWQATGEDNGPSPEGHILAALTRRGLVTTATPGAGSQSGRQVAQPPDWARALQVGEQLQRNYIADRGLLIEFTDERGRKLIYVLLRRSHPDSERAVGWNYREEIFDAASMQTHAVAQFGSPSGIVGYLTTPVLLPATCVLELLILAWAILLAPLFRRRRSAPGGFPVVVRAQAVEGAGSSDEPGHVKVPARTPPGPL